MGAWLAFKDNFYRDKHDTLQAAQRSFQKPYYVSGIATIKNSHTGEEWKRVKGGWYKVIEGRE